MLSRLRRDVSLLTGCVAGVIVTGVGEFYTKDVARDMVFAANQAGCAFLGRPLVEATGSLRNFRVQAQIGGVNEETAFRASISELIERLAAWEKPGPIRHILAPACLPAQHLQHSGLWELVRRSAAAGDGGGGNRPAQRHRARLQRLQLHRMPAFR